MLTQHHGRLTVETQGQGFSDISKRLQAWLNNVGARDGLLTVFIRHTSASLTIQENADPDVLADLQDLLHRIAPENTDYRHNSEGADDMPGHMKAMLTTTSLSVPVVGSVPVLGTWQGVFLIEHRAAAHRRQLALHYIGTTTD